MLLAINFWAVLVAAIASYVIGWAWYSLIFAKLWLKLHGIDETSVQNMQMPYGTMAVEFVTTLIITFFIGEFAVWVGAFSWLGGVVLAFWIWLGFYATTLMGGVLWEKVPVKLYMINVSRWLVCLLAMGAIIGAWR